MAKRRWFNRKSAIRIRICWVKFDWSGKKWNPKPFACRRLWKPFINSLIWSEQTWCIITWKHSKRNCNWISVKY